MQNLSHGLTLPEIKSYLLRNDFVYRMFLQTSIDWLIDCFIYFMSDISLIVLLLSLLIGNVIACVIVKLKKLLINLLLQYSSLTSFIVHSQPGRRHGFESGGQIFDRPLFGEGTKYCIDIAKPNSNSYVCFVADWQWC